MSNKSLPYHIEMCSKKHSLLLSHSTDAVTLLTSQPDSATINIKLLTYFYL